MLPQSPTVLVGKSTLCWLPSLLCLTFLTSGFSLPPTRNQTLVPELAFGRTYTKTVGKEGSMFCKGQQREGKHRGVDACGMQGTVGAVL